MHADLQLQVEEGARRATHAQRQRLQHRAAEGRDDADAPVHQLVATAFHDQGALVSNEPGALGPLLPQATHQGLSGLVNQAMLGAEAGASVSLGPRHQRADQGRHLVAELFGPQHLLTAPKGQLARLARCRRDVDTVGRDFLNAPGRRAQANHLAGTALKDHFLVELADFLLAAGRLVVAAHEVHAVQAAIGDGAHILDGHPVGACPRHQQASVVVKADAPAQAVVTLQPEGHRRPPRHQVDDGVKGPPRQVAVVGGASYQAIGIVWTPRLHGDHADQVLAQHVDGVLWYPRGLDGPFVHGLDDGGAGQQVARVARKDHAAADGADAVTGAAHPLQSGTHAGRRLDLHHHVDTGEVDPQLQR